MADKDEQMELWEIQTPGGVWVFRKNPVTGTYDSLRIHGTKGPKRVTLSAHDREYTQVLIRDDRRETLDPFANGTLAQVIDGKLVGTRTTEELARYIEVQGEAFVEAISELNELTARRLLDIAMTEGSVPQVEALREYIDTHWRVGGTQRTVREMYDAGELDSNRMTLSGS